jgi:hypothetical protein
LNAQCVAGGAEDLDFDIYTVENPCYWTKPLQVHENTACRNIAELNSATYPVVNKDGEDNAIVIKRDYGNEESGFEKPYTVNQCHKLCH